MFSIWLHFPHFWWPILLVLEEPTYLLVPVHEGGDGEALKALAVALEEELGAGQRPRMEWKRGKRKRT